MHTVYSVHCTVYTMASKIKIGNEWRIYVVFVNCGDELSCAELNSMIFDEGKQDMYIQRERGREITEKWLRHAYQSHLIWMHTKRTMKFIPNY